MNLKQLAKKYVPRLGKFAIIGQIGFWINTLVVFILVRYWPYMAIWFLTAVTGYIIEYTLLNVVNQHRKGIIFDSCHETEKVIPQKTDNNNLD